MIKFKKLKLTLYILILTIVTLANAYYLAQKLNSKKPSITKSIITKASSNIRSTDDMTNIILLGIGGKDHEAPDLTDSMMLISINHNTNKITMISIPRDIWIEDMQAKINTAYFYGNKQNNDGLSLVKTTIGQITGLPIHYAFVLDFNGFIRAIDSVGGIDVTVERTFDDYKYPIPGKENAEPESERYEHLHFEKGLQHFDGSTALKFARSRHAIGDEGSDFARSKRQQQIIRAFMKKLFSLQTLLNIQTINNFTQEIQGSFNTDISKEEYISFLKILMELKKHPDNIKSISITDLFISPKDTRKFKGQWVLIPKKDWQEIHEYIKQNLQ